MERASHNAVPVRDLKEFEKTALDQLRGGAHLVGEGNENVVGPIYAQASCMACHDGDEGALLGAFSYKLEEQKRESPGTWRGCGKPVGLALEGAGSRGWTGRQRSVGPG